MLRVAICEDEPLQAEIISALLEKYNAERPGADVQPYSFSCADTLLQSMDGGQEFDAFLLDILLPEMNGIELARALRVKNADAALVFLTSTASYAFDAFKVSAAQYILKPIKHGELFPALDNIIATRKQEKERFFMLATQKNSVKIPYGAIVCVELSKRSLMFYLENGETLRSVTIRVSFVDAVGELLKDDRFLYEHKSFALNMAHVKEIGSASFKMTGGIEVPIPRYNFTRAKAKYFEWLKKSDNVHDL